MKAQKQEEATESKAVLSTQWVLSTMDYKEKLIIKKTKKKISEDYMVPIVQIKRLS